MSSSTLIEIQDLPLWDRLKAKRTPLSFDIELTARCNNDCRHCYINLPMNDRSAQARELSATEIEALAAQAVKLGAVWCLITGGEPLLRPDFAEIYLMLKRRGLLVSVFTNATLVTGSHIALFKKYPPRDMEVTVYGVTRATYERVTRKPGSFDRFLRGLGLLLDAGVHVRLKAMAIRSNIDEQAAIASFCRTHTSDYFRFDPQLHLRFDGNPQRNEDIRAERLAPEQIVALEQRDEKRMTALKSECGRFDDRKRRHEGSDELFHCSAGSGSFHVSFDGTFRLCASLWAPETVYDLRKGSLTEAWHDFVPHVRARRSTRHEILSTCRVCPLVNLCLWCPAHAHLETGDMEGLTPYFCAVAHARARAAALP